MDRVRIKEIINKLDDISQKYTDEEFNLGVYIYVRYGIFEFNNYICDDELEEINKILKRHCTMFNEEINDDVSFILEDDEEDDGDEEEEDEEEED